MRKLIDNAVKIAERYPDLFPAVFQKINILYTSLYNTLIRLDSNNLFYFDKTFNKYVSDEFQFMILFLCAAFDCDYRNVFNVWYIGADYGDKDYWWSVYHNYGDLRIIKRVKRWEASYDTKNK